MILVSFPQIEGPTSFEQPATGRLDRTPISVHAQTRLEEERRLFERTKGTAAFGRVSHWGDTARARAELLPDLRYATLGSGLSTL